MGVSTEDHGGLAKLAGEDDAKVGRVIVAEDEDGVRLPVGERFDCPGIIEAAKMMGARILAYVFEDLEFVSVQ